MWALPKFEFPFLLCKFIHCKFILAAREARKERKKIMFTHWVKPDTWSHHVNLLLMICYCWKTKYRYASNSAFQFVWGPFRSLIGTKEFEVLRSSRSHCWNENCFCVGVAEEMSSIHDCHQCEESDALLIFGPFFPLLHPYVTFENNIYRMFYDLGSI